MEARHIRAVHKSSMAVVWLSLAYFLSGLAAGPEHRAAFHISMMAAGMLGAFVVAVESSYIVSTLRAKSHPLMPAALAGLVAAPPIAAAAAPLGALAGPGPAAAAIAAALALEAVAAIVAAGLTRGSVRLSMAASAYASLAGAAYSALAAGVEPLVVAGLGFLAAYPLQMIYAVSIHAFPSTYSRRPIAPLAPAPFALATLAAALIAVEPGEWRAAALLAGLSTLAYLPAARVHEAPRIWGEVASSRRPPIVVKTHKYFLEGHVFVAIIAAFTVALALLALEGAPITPGCIAHALAIGFAGLHIMIHAPMMLPVILNIPTARRYTPLPYALLALAPPSLCIDKRLAAPLVLLAVASGALIVWPPRGQTTGGARASRPAAP